MQIFRVEHSNGAGPYVSSRWPDLTDDQLESLFDMGSEHGRDYAGHPTPQDEGLPYDESYYCGFSSLEKLLAWFDGWTSFLARCGFMISIYEVQQCDVEPGDIQVIFYREMADLIERKSLTIFAEADILIS